MDKFIEWTLFPGDFGHQIIDSVPMQYLCYDRLAYSFPWPKGYYKDSKNSVANPVTADHS